MAPPVSASPSSETSAKLHPYQDFYPEEQQPGPKYSFETRNTPPGLRVRVDMPGVPKDGVKVVQYNETRTVTFTGKAKTPPVWTEFDTDDSRVYAGYVVLDRDPNNVKSTYEVEDGVLRMFFPNCDGSLHFLSPHNAPVQHVETGLEEEHEHFSDQNISYINHSPFEPSGIALSPLCSGKLEHINPHLIRGTKGVYEHRVVTVDREHQIYVRVDVPGTYDISSTLTENPDRGIMFQAVGLRENQRFGEGICQYAGVLQPDCYCCEYRAVKYNLTDGVLRFLARKSDNKDPTPMCHILLLSTTPGGDPQPTILPLSRELPSALGTRKFW